MTTRAMAPLSGTVGGAGPRASHRSISARTRFCTPSSTGRSGARNQSTMMEMERQGPVSCMKEAYFVVHDTFFIISPNLLHLLPSSPVYGK
jgi:hypothetical protein